MTTAMQTKKGRKRKYIWLNTSTGLVECAECGYAVFLNQPPRGKRRRPFKCVNCEA